MKRSTIEAKLNEAMQRHVAADRDEDYFTGQINYHDREASRLRKLRQGHRNKKDRALATIAKLNKLLSTDITC